MSEWIEKPLGELVSFKKGKKVETSDLALEGYQPYLGASSLTGGQDGFALPDAGISCENGDALMLWDGERSGLVGPGKSGVISSTVMRLRPEAEMAGRYLVHFLRDRFEWIQARRTGTGVPHVPKDLARILKLHFPKSDIEQFTICDILDALDTQIEATEALIAKQERVRAGLMQDLFTRGVDEHGQLRPPRDQAPHLYHQTKLGWLPLGWEVHSIRSAVRNIIDYRGVPPPKASSGVPLITAKNVRFGYLDPEPREFIAEADFKSWMRRGLPSVGDVIFTTEAPLGNVAQIPDYDLALGQRTLTLQPNLDLICHNYLKWTLMSEIVQTRIKRLQSGSTATGIQSRTFRNILLELPKVEEQKHIVAHLNRGEAIEDALLNELSKLRLQKSGLMQDLLTGKVPVTPLLETRTPEGAAA